MSFSITKTLALTGCLIVGFASSNLIPSTRGQESETTLKELQQEWLALDAKISAKETELKAKEDTDEVLQKEFEALIEKANEHIKKLESAAVARLESHPDDSETTRTLLGIMVDHAHFGRDRKVLTLGDALINAGVNPQYFVVASRSERLSIPAREIFDELIIRQAEATKGDFPRVKLITTKGDIVLELFENEAPGAVGNFISLVESDYYTDMLFHRVVDDFMAQGGGFKLEGKNEVGGKGPGYEIKCECDAPDKRLHFSGSLSMAHRGKDTGGSQFFLTFSRTSFLDGRHTCFGRVVSGQDVLDQLVRTHITSNDGTEMPIPDVTKDKIKKAEVLRKRDHVYAPDKSPASEPTSEKK